MLTLRKFVLSQFVLLCLGALLTNGQRRTYHLISSKTGGKARGHSTPENIAELKRDVDILKVQVGNLKLYILRWGKNPPLTEEDIKIREEWKKIEEQKKLLEEERKKFTGITTNEGEDSKNKNEERKKYEEEKRKLEEEKSILEEQRRQVDEERRKFGKERRKTTDTKSEGATRDESLANIEERKRLEAAKMLFEQHKILQEAKKLVEEQKILLQEKEKIENDRKKLQDEKKTFYEDKGQTPSDDQPGGKQIFPNTPAIEETSGQDQPPKTLDSLLKVVEAIGMLLIENENRIKSLEEELKVIPEGSYDEIEQAKAKLEKERHKFNELNEKLKNVKKQLQKAIE